MSFQKQNMSALSWWLNAIEGEFSLVNTEEHVWMLASRVGVGVTLLLASTLQIPHTLHNTQPHTQLNPTKHYPTHCTLFDTEHGNLPYTLHLPSPRPPSLVYVAIYVPGRGGAHVEEVGGRVFFREPITITSKCVHADYNNG